MKYRFFAVLLSVILCLSPISSAWADETPKKDEPLIEAVETTDSDGTESESSETSETDDAVLTDTNVISVSVDKKERISGNGLYFSIESSEDGGKYAAVTGRKVSDRKKIKIPEAIILEDIRYEVKAIADSAFAQTDISEVSIPDSIEKIGNMAFLGCEELTSVIIPRKCLSIGYAAFMNCSGLAEVDFNNTKCTEIGELAFANTALTDVELSDMTEILRDSCFSGCSSLKTVHIGANCESIGIGVFSGASSLEKITKSKYNKKFKIVKGCIYTRDGETLVSGAAAKGKLVLEKGVKTLYEYAFEGNSRIKTVTVPGTVKTIPEGCFMNCSALKKVTVKNGVKSLGLCSFGSDAKLTKVSLPKSLKKVEGNPFVDSSKLVTLTVSEKNKYLKVKDGVLYSADMKTLISAPGVSGSFSLPSECRKIADYAFYSNQGIEKVSFNAGLKSVGFAAFYGCGSLKSVYMASRDTVLCGNPEEYDSVSGMIFYMCNKNLEISVPFSVEAGAKGSLEENIENNCDTDVMITQH